jgi:hypothetical protein
VGSSRAASSVAPAERCSQSTPHGKARRNDNLHDEGALTAGCGDDRDRCSTALFACSLWADRSSDPGPLGLDREQPFVADAIAGSDYRGMSKGVVRPATAGLPRHTCCGSLRSLTGPATKQPRTATPRAGSPTTRPGSAGAIPAPTVSSRRANSPRGPCAVSAQSERRARGRIPLG